MGWTRTWKDTCPKGNDRIMMAIEQEGYEYKEKTRSNHVIDSALVGTTVYLAVHHINTENGVDEVYGAVILTEYDPKRNNFFTKGISETMGPSDSKCPKRILDKLSPTDNEYANEWRNRCRNKKKSDNPLAGVPQGTKIRLLSGAHMGDIFTKTTWNGKTCWMGIVGGHYMKGTARTLNSYKWEFVKE